MSVKRLLFIFTLVIVSASSKADKLDKAFEALKVHNYFEAKRLFENQLNKHIVASSYGLSVLYSAKSFFHSVDSARIFIVQAENHYDSISPSQVQKLEELGVTKKVIHEQKRVVGIQAFEEALKLNTIEGFEQFVIDFSFSEKFKEALDKRNTLAFIKTKEIDTHEAFQSFMHKYPNAIEYEEAKELYQEKYYAFKTADRRVESFQNYLKENPESPFKRNAQDMIYTLSVKKGRAIEYSNFIKNFPENPNVNNAWRKLFYEKTKAFSAGQISTFLKENPDYPFKDQLVEELELIDKVYFHIVQDGKWGVADANWQTLIETKYDWISAFNESVAVFSFEDKYGYIKKNGVIVVPPIYDDALLFYKGNGVVEKDDKFGIIDVRGKIILPLEYDEIGAFKEELAFVSKEGKYGYIDASSRIIAPLVWDFAGDFFNGYAIVERGGKRGLMNKNGELVIPCMYDWIEHFSNGLARVKLDGKFGVINIKNTFIVNTEYDQIGKFSEGLAIVAKFEKYGYLDTAGQIVLPLEYDYFPDVLNWGNYEQGCIKLLVKEKYGHIDRTGKRVYPAMFDNIGRCGEELIAVKKRGKWGYANQKVDLVISYKYDFAWDFDGKYAKVRYKDKEGIINVKGKYLVSMKYDKLEKLNSEGLYLIKNDGLWGLLDVVKYKEILPTQYEKIEKYRDNIYQVIEGGKLRYFSTEGHNFIWKEK